LLWWNFIFLLELTLVRGPREQGEIQRTSQRRERAEQREGSNGATRGQQGGSKRAARGQQEVTKNTCIGEKDKYRQEGEGLCAS
jgi:hypothetical protein